MTMISVRIDNRIRIADKLKPEVVEALHEAFERKNPSFWMLRRKGLRSWGEPPILKAWKNEGNELTFPRGAWSTVRDVLREHGEAFKITDARNHGEPARKLTHFVETRDYQDEGIAIALKRENTILRASTGAGKTTTGLGLAAAVETICLVIVDSKEIASEWVRRCQKELEIEPGFIGDGRYKIERVTIALHQSIARLKSPRLDEVIRRFGCVIVDEVQICGAETYGRNVDRMPARYRFGLSDDHHRVDGKTFLVTDLFGQVSHKIGDKELLERGAIADFEVIVDPTDFTAPWFVEATRNEDGAILQPSAVDRTQLIDEISDDDRRSSRIAARVAAEIAKGRRFLVYTHRVRHAEKLARMLTAAGVPTGLMLGGTAEFDRTRSGLLSNLVKAGVGTIAALGKGVNVPDVDDGYAATPIVTSRQTFRQASGRVKRPKASGGSARFFVAWDGKVFGDAPIRKLVKWHRGKVQIAVGSKLVSPVEYAATMKGK